MPVVYAGKLKTKRKRTQNLGWDQKEGWAYTHDFQNNTSESDPLTMQPNLEFTRNIYIGVQCCSLQAHSYSKSKRTQNITPEVHFCLYTRKLASRGTRHLLHWLWCCSRYDFTCPMHSAVSVLRRPRHYCFNNEKQSQTWGSTMKELYLLASISLSSMFHCQAILLIHINGTKILEKTV